MSFLSSMVYTDYYPLEIETDDDDVYKIIGCRRRGIPYQIICQSICKKDSQFHKYTIKELKNVHEYIQHRLNDNMDQVILNTYNNYDFLAIKFEVDYLRARYFKCAMRSNGRQKSAYINFLDFMAATGLFEYELNNIEEISKKAEIEREQREEERHIKRENMIRKHAVLEGLVEYLKETHDINLDDSDDCWERFEEVSQYCEFVDQGVDYYEEVAKDNPNKYFMYKWNISDSEEILFMSEITITSTMAMVIYCDAYSLTLDTLDESIENAERLLNIPVEQVMSLEEYVIYKRC